MKLREVFESGASRAIRTDDWDLSVFFYEDDERPYMVVCGTTRCSCVDLDQVIRLTPGATSEKWTSFQESLYY